MLGKPLKKFLLVLAKDFSNAVAKQANAPISTVPSRMWTAVQGVMVGKRTVIVIAKNNKLFNNIKYVLKNYKITI